jgi:hypothetical protein
MSGMAYWVLAETAGGLVPSIAASSVRTGKTRSSFNATNASAASNENVLKGETSRDDLLQALQARAHVLYARNQLNALPRAKKPKIHYMASRFHVSPTSSVSSSYRLIKFTNHSEEWSDEQACTTVRRVVCEANHPVAFHFAHFAQAVFPCWSVFQDFPDAQGIMEVPSYLKGPQSGWIGGMMRVFRNAGVHIIAVNETLPKETTTTHTTATSSVAQVGSCDWRAIQDTAVQSAWPVYDVDSASTTNTRYFATREHMDALQEATLGDDFRQGPSQESTLRVLLFARNGASRKWMYTTETATLLNKAWNNFSHHDNSMGTLLSVHVRPDYDSTPFLKQALEMHNSDIIVSPHGAQLTNLAFIRPCTVVLELFPMGYYLGFFQPYVLSAHGVPFDGYPYDRDRLADTKISVENVTIRGRIKMEPVWASPESIAHAFPQLVLDLLTCREGWDTLAGILAEEQSDSIVDPSSGTSRRGRR